MLSRLSSLRRATSAHQVRSFSGYVKLEPKRDEVSRKVTVGRETMSASEAFVETLVAQDVKHVFGIVGSAFMDALDLFPEAGIRFVSTQHEQNAIHMADGYARVSGECGVCTAQNGPGISNFVTGAAAAYWAHSPVVMITPEGGSNTKGMGGFQEVPGKGGQMEMFASSVKYQVDIRNATRFAEQTSYAFDIARAERGPAQINFARDLLYNVGEYEIPRPLTRRLPMANPASIDEAAKLFAKAKRPVILAGGGVVMSDGGVESLRRFVDEFQVPVATTYLHADVFPNSHDNYLGPLGYLGSMSAMRAMQSADFVFALGCRLNPFGTLPQYHDIIGDYWPTDATLVQCDIDQRRLGLTKRPDVAIQGDAGLTIEQFGTRVRDLACDGLQVDSLMNVAERRIQMDGFKEEWRDTLTFMTETGEERDGRIRPRKALREIVARLPADIAVSTDIGNVCSVANSYLQTCFNDPEHRQSFLAAMTYGNCQYSLGAALGAKVAQPYRPVISMAGDGAFGMGMNELVTCAREKIPITSIVFNNGQWGAEKKNQVLWFGDRYIGVQLEEGDMEKSPISFAKIAESMGVRGIRVTHEDEVGDAITEALRLQMEENVTAVVEVMCTKELGDPFRRDAMKLPKRLLEKYKGTDQHKESETGQPTDL